jgi:hypothetical protein
MAPTKATNEGLFEDFLQSVLDGHFAFGRRGSGRLLLLAGCNVDLGSLFAAHNSLSLCRALQRTQRTYHSF